MWVSRIYPVVYDEDCRLRSVPNCEMYTSSCVHGISNTPNRFISRHADPTKFVFALATCSPSVDYLSKRTVFKRTCHVVAPTVLLDIGAASLSRALFGRACDGSLRLLFFVTLLAPTLSVIVLLTCFSLMPRLLMANALFESAG